MGQGTLQGMGTIHNTNTGISLGKINYGLSAMTIIDLDLVTVSYSVLAGNKMRYLQVVPPPLMELASFTKKTFLTANSERHIQTGTR